MSEMPCISCFDTPSHLVDISRREALRYLGYRSLEAGDGVLARLAVLEEQLRGQMICRACFAQYPLLREGERLCFGGLSTESRDLAHNLAGCDGVILFAATLGAGVDRLIARNGRISAADGVMTDALASAAVEGFCDAVEAFAAGGQPHRPRFSPGYGDLPLAFQKNLLGATDASRKIGLTLTESLMMAPTKSVTAIIGLKTKNF